MKKSILTAICFTVICSVSISQDKSISPKIISTLPEFGDCNVDPEIKEIILRFDQDMSSGMSITNSKNLPQYSEKMHWIDKRTFSIPVRLYPDRLYSISFNSSRFQNFKSIEGVPMNPDDLIFKTKEITNSDVNRKAYKEFSDLFPRMYSYASIKGIDWKATLAKSQSELENSTTPTEFALKIIKLLRPAEDPHLLVEVDGEKYETGKMKIININYNTGQVFSILRDKKASPSFSVTSGAYDSIGYFAIRDWTMDLSDIKLRTWGNSQNPEFPAFDVLKELTAYPDLIIDVRENSGGNESFAKKLASLFVADSIPYEKVLNYNEKSGKYDKEHIKMLYPSPNRIYYKGRIYVLSGPAVMSSNESFILMMKQLPYVTIVGMKSYGSSGNPRPYTMSNGVTLHLPSWLAYTMDGKLIEGNGIDPDIEIVTNREDFQKEDILFKKVISLIKE